MPVEAQVTINGSKAAIWAAITNIENAAKILPLCLACSLALPASALAQVVNILHTFTGGAADGNGPGGGLLQSGSTLYGMTDAGGSAGDGTLFQIGIDGTGFSLKHSFGGLPDDGANPFGSPIQSGSSLYGLTSGGGSANQGTVFTIGISGTGLALLHQFAGGAGDGTGPSGSPVQSGSTLYGMTIQGGATGLGTIFKVGTDGGGFSVIHSFTGGANDGQSPNYGSLVVAGTTLYGMTLEGGAAGLGTVFKINTDGSGFTILHTFTGVANDGSTPDGSLTIVGSTLYGMTRFGGAAGTGTAFKIGMDGTGFTVLHSFAGSPGDGANSAGDLTLVGSKLYGMTYSGGPDALGTLFGIDTDGTGYSVLHNFQGGATDGASPLGDLIYYNSTLYGMTGSGGDGTIFSFPIIVPEPGSLTLVGTAVAGAFCWAVRWQRKEGASFTNGTS